MHMLTVRSLILTAYLSSIYCAKWTVRFKTFIIPYKESADMECEISGDFYGFYNSKNEEILHTPGKINVIKTDDNIRTLEILNVNETDYGEYVCKDGISEDRAVLEIASSIQTLEKLYKLAIGFEGRILAEVYGKPRKPVSWYKVTSDGSQSLIIKQNDKLELEGDTKAYDIIDRGSLLIKTVTSTDGGKYIISVKADGAKLKKETSVVIGERPKIISRPLDNYTITENLDLHVPCMWKGADSAGSQWIFNDKELTEGTDSEGLTITGVTQASAGNYSCSAKNDFGSTSVRTIIDVITSPVITDLFQDANISQNNILDLKCNASGIPAPMMKIMKRTDNGMYNLLWKAISLATVSYIPVTVQQRGTYKCTAENGAKDKDGKNVITEKIITVDVLTVPVIIPEMTTDSITSALGLAYKIKCAAGGNPLPKLSIIHNGTVKKESDGKIKDGVITITYSIPDVGKDDFGVHVCVAKNIEGSSNRSINVIEVLKPKPPTGLNKLREPPGLEYIDIQWNAVVGADSYIIYVNKTENEKPLEIPTTSTEYSVKGLRRSTRYSFQVASVNIAGIGEKSEAVTIKTSDITKPGPVSKITTMDVTSISASLTWDPPKNVENQDLLTYRVIYCKVDKNGTVSSNCGKRSEKKDNSVDLESLERGTTYRITVVAFHQRVEGEQTVYTLVTKDATPLPPSKAGSTDSLSSGAVVGVIVAVIIIILIIIDLFCCFFNNCGFSHCFFNTFCGVKGKKYAPADTNDGGEELKPKKEVEPTDV